MSVPPPASPGSPLPAALPKWLSFWSNLRRLGLFLLVFVCLQSSYKLLASSAVERLFVETAGSRPAAQTIRLLTPELAVQARGSQLAAPGGGINIRNGCEGSDTLFLLIAAFSAASLRWRARVIGLVVGVPIVLALNQIRIVSLFYAFRADRNFFDLLHTTVAPLAMVILVFLYFHVCLLLAAKPPAASA